jgi:hypothetical protein
VIWGLPQVAGVGLTCRYRSAPIFEREYQTRIVPKGQPEPAELPVATSVYRRMKTCTHFNDIVAISVSVMPCCADAACSTEPAASVRYVRQKPVGWGVGLGERRVSGLR